MPETNNIKDNKIVSAFDEIINFLNLFLKTYLNIILHPVKFLKSMQPGSNENVDKADPVIFFLITTFFFVLTVDIIEKNTHILTQIFRNLFVNVFVNIFQFNGLNDIIHLTINQIVNISVLKVIFVTLPLVVWVYFYLTIISSAFFTDTEQKHIVRRTFKYFTSAAFFSLTVIFLWEFFLFKLVINPIAGNYNAVWYRNSLPFIQYGIPGLFYVYLLLLPLISSWKAFPKGQAVLRKKYMLISILLIPIFLLNFKVCVFQNNIDDMFNPLPRAKQEQPIEFIYKSPLTIDTVNSKIALEVILYNRNVDHFILDSDSGAVLYFGLMKNAKNENEIEKAKESGGGGGSSTMQSSYFIHCTPENNLPDIKTPHAILKPGDFTSLKFMANINNESKAYINEKADDNISHKYGYIISLWGLADSDSTQRHYITNLQKIQPRYAIIKDIQ